MRLLFLDCGMGAAGDMLQGALVSLLSKEDQESFINDMNNIGLDDVKVSLADDVKCGITCSHISVSVSGHEEHSEDVHEHEHHHEECHNHDEHEHEHSHHGHEHGHHGHEHHHEHHHSSLHDIRHIVDGLNVSDRVKKDINEIYEIIAEAESKVHGKNVSEVHFHEVGMKDAIADIAGVAVLMEKIGADRIICSPVNTGFGKVRCAHGILPVPAPATAEIIQGIPSYAGRFEGEMCTPTGAALIRYYADDFSQAPLMIQEKTGYGSGNKDFDAANVVKAVIGESFGQSDTDQITEFRCNIDDMTGEDLAFAVEKIMEAGARDAFVSSVLMKKGRMGFLLTVLVDSDKKEEIAGIIFKHTTTIGIREYSVSRMILNRRIENRTTEYGDVAVKISEGYGVKKEKAEFEDLKRIAVKLGTSIADVRNLLEDSE